jgi:hypothetical protein
MDAISLLQAELDLLQIFALETLHYEPHQLTFRTNRYYRRLWRKRLEIMLDIISDAYTRDITLLLNGVQKSFRRIFQQHVLIEAQFEAYLKGSFVTDNYECLHHFIKLHRKWNMYMRKIITFFPL